MTAPPEVGDTHLNPLGHRIGSRYRAGVATKRVTPQHTIAVDDGLWQDCLKIARMRHETLTTVLKQALLRYRAKHKAMLDESP